MRSFAGTVCGLITTLIYGMAIIGGIFYHNAYVKSYEQAHPDMEVRFSTEYFVTWAVFLCVAAVISAIHHALWTIIDNQLELYSELHKQNEVLETIQKAQLSVDSKPAQNISEIKENIPGSVDHVSKQWTCSNCGNINTGSRCTQCGLMQY